MKLVLLACVLAVVLPVGAYATPYVAPEDALGGPSHEDEWIVGSVQPGECFYEYDGLTRLLMCADFITTLQVSDTSSAAYGGMREGEHLLSIIQTDNTSESIWLWTHCYRLTGSDDYRDNIDAAWEYCMNFRAYDEEGGDDRVTGYYRVYNCAWAVRAEMEYRQVYGDPTYSAYAESCASYLCHHPMYLYFPTGMARRLNGMIMGWAVGNLYEYGADVGSSTYMARAVDLADSVKAWVETNPNKFHWKEWAMGGGSVMWGLVHSYFAGDPTGLESWAATYAPYLDTEVDSSQYQNAWRAWAALGQVTAGEVLGSDTYCAYFKHLADTLVLNDGDSDGGIPVIDAEPDDHDQSWVTNYLGFMCMDKLIATAGVASGASPGGPALRVSASPVPSVKLPSLLFNLDKASDVSVRVFDVAGRRVASSDAGVLAPGSHLIPLDRACDGVQISPGVYFYTLSSGGRVANGKVIVVK